MKMWLIAGLFLGFLALSAPRVSPQEPASRGPLPFNPRTVETIQGMVVEAPEFKPGGFPEMERLLLKTDKEKLTVVLGPNWYLARQGWKIAILDHLEVTGSRVELDGKTALIAQEVKKGEQIMRFRDQSGRPLWSPSQTHTP
jgi:hypothetical protein